jgi:hypothetical protein
MRTPQTSPSVLADDDPSSVQYEAVLQQIDTALGLNSSTS